jgi:hypothetical protein
VFPVGIGLRDPRSQKRDLGHPSISPFDVAERNDKGERGIRRGSVARSQDRRSLHFATPDFLLV